MDDKDTIAFLNRKSRHHATLASQATTSEERFIQEDEANRYASAAARLRELADDNEVLRAECNEGRNVLRPGAPNDAHKKYVASKVATDARAALEPKGTERLARQGEGGGHDRT